MEYERKYKAALKWMQSLYSGLHGATKEEAEKYFPELKDSEDERIVKCLLNYFNHVRYNGLDLKGTDVDEVIAWLEKQGEQKHFSDFKAEDWYVSKVDGKIHNMTYNPTDKVKPKFKVGDFIVNDYCRGKIIELTNDAYLLDTGQAIPFSCEHNAHLWTIKDAKAGDVLVYETDEVEWIFIYREIVPAASEVPHDLLRYYFLLEGNYFNWNGVSAMITDDYKLYLKPATKEQQDTLFAKMKEAGYEWDSEKKELKKIEVKTLDANKVIEWLKNTIRENKIKFSEYNSIEDIINDFKEDFGLC